MRITLLNQYYAPDESATAQVLSDLGVALVAKGRAVRGICGDRSYADPGRRYPRRDVIDGVDVERVGTTAFGRKSKLGRSVDYVSFYVSATARLLFGPKPDVVVALTTPPFIGLAAVLAGKFRRFPVALWSMDVYPDVAFELGAIRRDSLLGRFLAALGRLLHRSADFIVALGETMAERLREDGVNNVIVIHNWADAGVERRLDEVAHRKLARSDSEPFTVMYSGNMGMAHEFETALQSAERLPEVRFVFVGGGPRKPEIEESIRTLSLLNADMRGYVARDRLAESLTAPDVHLVTLRDSMPGLLVPSKIYGVLAAGKPTIYIGPARGEIHDIVSGGKCGVSLRVGDVDGMVSAILTYRRNPELLSEQGRAARAMYEAQFTREKSIGRFVAAIERLQAVGEQ